ncbi:MAG: 50S ribosomal protein L11 methyltransferase [Lachnospiraceae bacterium]|nr:50S ribosomal protein L11 methyltransferase [Lachnospiraceae bacterium]
MKYNRYTIKSTVEAEDIISSALDDIGVIGVEIEDKQPLSERDKAEMFVDIPPEYEEDDGIAYLSFYLDASKDNEIILEEIRNELNSMKSYVDIGEGSISVKELADEDYLNNWKQYFHQFYIGDMLFIPSWEEPADTREASMVIHVDPGTAFGTGKHETTKLCILALKKYIKEGDRLLDIGTGSGILSVMAYKFGAKEAVGTDLDVCAIEAVKNNMEANGLGDAGFELIIGNIIDNEEIQEEAGFDKYDVVVANILAEVLKELTPEVVRHIKKDGIYIVSGIIDDKEAMMLEVLKEAGFKVMEIYREGEWVCIVSRAL